MKNNTTYAISVLIAGINRFYGEGMVYWSKKNLNIILQKENTEIFNVLETFKDWETKRFIQLIGDDDKYIKVLKKIK
jgi:hypothetical protein